MYMSILSYREAFYDDNQLGLDLMGVKRLNKIITVLLESNISCSPMHVDEIHWLNGNDVSKILPIWSMNYR